MILCGKYKRKELESKPKLKENYFLQRIMFENVHKVFFANHGLCDDEPYPKSRTNKPPGNLWIFSSFSQCHVNMLNLKD